VNDTVYKLAGCEWEPRLALNSRSRDTGRHPHQDRGSLYTLDSKALVSNSLLLRAQAVTVTFSISCVEF
jgi:hypothetical protein